MSTDQISEIPVYQDKYEFTLDKFSKLGHVLEEIESKFIEDNKEVLDNRTVKEEKLQQCEQELQNLITEAKSIIPPKFKAKIEWTSTEKLVESLLKSYEIQFAENLKFIKTNRTLQEIIAENIDLNNFEEGFKVENYDELRKEVEKVSSKIENKNFEFEKLRTKWNDDIQTMAIENEKVDQ